MMTRRNPPQSRLANSQTCRFSTPTNNHFIIHPSSPMVAMTATLASKAVATNRRDTWSVRGESQARGWPHDDGSSAATTTESSLAVSRSCKQSGCTTNMHVSNDKVISSRLSINHSTRHGSETSLKSLVQRKLLLLERDMLDAQLEELETFLLPQPRQQSPQESNRVDQRLVKRPSLKTLASSLSSTKAMTEEDHPDYRHHNFDHRHDELPSNGDVLLHKEIIALWNNDYWRRAKHFQNQQPQQYNRRYSTSCNVGTETNNNCIDDNSSIFSEITMPPLSTEEELDWFLKTELLPFNTSVINHDNGDVDENQRDKVSPRLPPRPILPPPLRNEEDSRPCEKQGCYYRPNRSSDDKDSNHTMTSKNLTQSNHSPKKTTMDEKNKAIAFTEKTYVDSSTQRVHDMPWIIATDDGKKSLQAFYSGPVVKELPYGVGMFRFTNGDAYIGQVVWGALHGKGTYFYNFANYDHDKDVSSSSMENKHRKNASFDNTKAKRSPRSHRRRHKDGSNAVSADVEISQQQQPMLLRGYFVNNRFVRCRKNSKRRDKGINHHHHQPQCDDERENERQP